MAHLKQSIKSKWKICLESSCYVSIVNLHVTFFMISQKSLLLINIPFHMGPSSLSLSSKKLSASGFIWGKKVLIKSVYCSCTLTESILPLMNLLTVSWLTASCWEECIPEAVYSFLKIHLLVKFDLLDR